ncbi:hypothetical protein ACFY9S_30570 [Streptomyces sp. NPDC012474]|uniref:hypothetical protein n=1 Tax=Streptomyces sp. NPDC012474 TaxID=3364836 RepID=UPI0036E59903
MLRTESREPNKLKGDTEAAAPDMTATAEPPPPTAGRDLCFQRCLWCGTPAYRRSFCRACGGTTFERERSTGAGVLVRRFGQAPLNTWFVAMAEGFNLLCQVTGTEPVVVAVGARVRVVRGAAPRGQGFPLVELTHRATSLGRWW